MNDGAKRYGKRVLTGLVCIALAIGGVLLLPPLIRTAEAETSGDYTYSVNEDGITATITGYTGAGGDITIPDTVTDGTNTYAVTAIGDSAFANNTLIATVMIPGSVASIGANAFSGCMQLRNAYFLGNAPSSDESIFSGCGASLTIYDVSTSAGFSDPWNGFAVKTFNPDATYTVSFDMNGAEGTAPDTQIVYEGVSAVCPADPSDGEKVFGGWYTEAECENEWNFNTGITGNITLFAQWADFFGSGTEEDPYQVSTPAQLDAVRNYPDACFIMTNDIDMIAATSEGGAYWNDGKGWEPIGDETAPFTGVLNGGNYAVRGLYQKTTGNGTVHGGLFGYMNGGTIRNLGMEGNSITISVGDAGGIVGFITEGMVDNCYHTGSVTGDTVGGIVGKAESNSTVTNCYNTGTITSEDSNSGGGIAGFMYKGVIEGCYNIGKVSGTYAGGISGSLGKQLASSSVSNSYNTGRVSGKIAGGIVGYVWDGFTAIECCYSVGNVNGDDTGGIVGLTRGDPVSICYYLDRTFLGTGDGLDTSLAVTSTQMMLQETFAGFDFDTVWTMQGDEDYPYPELQAVGMIALLASPDFAGGNGMPYDPYQIATVEQLDSVRDYSGSCFVLAGDIVFCGTEFEEGGAFYNGGAGFVPIGTGTIPFTGIFDGNGYAVKGLYENITLGGSASGYAGVFGCIKNCKIYGLGLEDSHITVYGQGLVHVGGIAGGAFNSTISGCYNTSRISGGLRTGGIAGTVTDCIISNCYNTGRISSNSRSLDIVWGDGYAGGVIGAAWPATIFDCYNAGSVSGGEYGGGIVGNLDANEFSVRNCYNVGNIGGRNAGAISGNSYYMIISDCYYLDNMTRGVGNGTDYGTMVSETQMAQPETFEGFDFDTTWTMQGNGNFPYAELQAVEMVVEPASSDFSGGNGMSYDPYQIATAQQLIKVSEHLDSSFVLMCDIEFTVADFAEGGAFYNDGSGFVPIGTAALPFTGMFDGNGYEIKGLVQNISGSFTIYGGLFGYVDFGAIDDLHLESCSITASGTGYTCYVGGIVGYLYQGTVSRCDVSGAITSVTQSTVGGIAGTAYGGAIRECVNQATVNGNDAGGIVGNMGTDARVNNCRNEGGILGEYKAGGIVGESYYNIIVTSCVNAGVVTIDGAGSSGGVVGYLDDGIIYDCNNLASINTGGNGITGGIAGGMGFATIRECCNAGNLSGSTVGGIVGKMGGVIDVCHNSGHINGRYAGGIAGFVKKTIHTTWDNIIRDCYNTGCVDGDSSYGFSGGVVGYMESGAIKTSYSNGIVDGITAEGGIVGKLAAGKIENCYYLSNIARGVGDGTDAGLAVTRDQMAQEVNFSGYNFDTIWTMAGNTSYAFPELQAILLEGIYVDTITVTSASDTVMVNGTIHMGVSISPENAHDKSCTWTVTNDTGEASIDESGLLTAIHPGIVIVTATSNDGSSVVGTKSITIMPVTAVLNVSLDISTAAMIIGDAITFTATVSPSDATYSTVTWSSSNTDVATVDQTGKVAAVSSGSAIITATADGVSDTCEVTVQPASYTIAVAANNSAYGRVSSGGAHSNGAVVTLTATPNAGYRFVRWMNGSTQVSTSASYTFTVSADMNLKAEFAAIGTPAVTAASAGYDRVNVSWSPVEGAAGYEVWRSASIGTGYAKVGTASGTSYTDAGLTTGTTNYYKVKAYCTASTATTYGSLSAYVLVTPEPLAPASPAAASSSYSSIKVSWSAVSGANGYRVYRASSAGGMYSWIGSTTSLSYTDGSRNTGTTYYYKVCAYCTVGRNTMNGADSAIVFAKPALSAVSSCTASAVDPVKVKVSWSSVPGRTRYEVWRSDNGGAYTLLGTTTSTSYSSTGLTPFHTYSYYIRVYRTVSGQKIYAAANSPAASAKPVLGSVTNVKAAMASASSVKLTWSSVSGASGYEVRRWDAASGKYVVVASTTRTYYTHSDLVPNVSYTYEVAAYRTVGSARVYSTACTPVSATPYFGAVTNVKAAMASASSVKLTWSSVSGASGYEVRRWDAATGKYVVVASTTRTYYTHTSLPPNVSYTYQVAAYRTVGSARVYSAACTPVSATPTLGGVTNPKAARSSSTKIKLTWNAVSGRTGYEIFRSATPDGTFVSVGTTTSTSYTNSGLTTGTPYYYIVKAYVTVNGVKYYGSASAVVTATP